LNDVSRHDTVISTVESTMRAVLRAQGMHGVVHPSSADDVLAFVCIPPDFAEGTLTRALEAELTPALEGLSQILPHAREHSLAQFVTEAHTSIEDVAESKLTLARLLKSVQMTAWGPDALNLTSERHLLDRALSMSAFEFHFQPIVDVRAGSVIAYEALCRGTLPNFRFPDQIFATAERFDRVWDLGHVLRDVAGEASSVLHASPQRGCMMFINVHPRDINDPTFERQVLDGPLAPHASSVVLELTERAAIVDYPGLRKLLSRLRSRGYRIAIDDLGSGYAGLTALAEIEPEFIKFDMGLVRDLHRRPVKQRLIERISGFAREMNATTISEGVETAEERDALLCCGSTLMQGYFFGRPAPEFAVLRPGDVVG
ncbi:MAG: EAL domain-containing protein, partial [Nannocystaceae bacterium]